MPALRPVLSPVRKHLLIVYTAVMLMSRLTSQAFRRKVAVPAVAAILVILYGVASNLLAGFLQDHLGILGDIVAWRWSPVVVLVILIVLFGALSSNAPALPESASTPVQTVADREAVSKIRAFLRVRGEPAYESEMALLQRISAQLIHTSDARRDVGILIQRFVLDAAQNALSAVRHSLSQPASSQDLQEMQRLLGDWYEKYQWMTTWIHQGADRMNLPLSSDGSYHMWRTLDQKFLSALQDLMTEPEFGMLRERVLAVGWGESFRHELYQADS